MASPDDWQNFTELITMMTDGKTPKPRGIAGLAGAFVSTPLGFGIAVYEGTIVADALRNIDEMLESINESMEVGFHNAKSKGIAEVRKYLESNWALDKDPLTPNKPRKIEGIEVYLPTLIKALQGKVRSIDQLVELNTKQAKYNFELYKNDQPKPPKYYVVYRNIKNENEKINDLYGYNAVIESVFCMTEEPASDSILPKIF